MPSVSEFLIERLENLGVKHIFGVSRQDGNPFVENIKSSNKIQFINNVDETGSGFSADTYARINGIGCVCANYNAGALKLCNSIAGAYAEKSPILVVSISPSIKNRNKDFILHHLVKSFDNQQKIFKNITCNSIILDDATKAGFAIDSAIEDLQNKKQPIYLELPVDIANTPIKYDVYRQGTPSTKSSDAETLSDAIQETSIWLESSNKPVILVGVQVVRYGLSDRLVRFAEKYNIPFMTTLLGKSSIDENHPLFCGVYCGKSSDTKVIEMIDGSDCLLVFGECVADMTLGFESPRFTKRQVVFCSTDGLYIKNHVYNNVTFIDFCNSLFAKSFAKKVVDYKPLNENDCKNYSKLFSFIDQLMANDKNLTVISDAGDYLIYASKIKVRQSRFFSPAFKYSSGFAIPGCLGVQLAKQELRPIVIIDENSFKISMLELPTILKFKLNPIIIVLGNTGFNFKMFRDFYGSGNGYAANSETDLESIINQCLKSKELSIINLNFNEGKN